MTKLLEEVVAKALSLSPEEQDAVAIGMIEAMASLDANLEDSPIPEWHQQVLDERMKELEKSPNDFITLDQFKRDLAKARADRQ